jgi:VanZ family protein
MILGVLDEWHQTLIPGREADVADLLADLAGIGFALIGFIIIARQREKKKENIFTIRQRQERE